MADGSTKPIEAIEVGDLVWASDPVTGEAGARAVSATITGDGQKHLVTITTGDGAVVATDGHPFWNPDDQVWETAGELEPGDRLLGADGITTTVTSIETVDTAATVHNFSVTDLHTYYVLIGETPTLVHNCGADAANSDSQPFAMGISDNLDDFANAHGAATWKQLDNPLDWQSGVMKKLENPNQRVLFNLDGVDVWPGVMRAASGRGGATDWELLQLKLGSFPNVEFWSNGLRVGSPF